MTFTWVIEYWYALQTGLLTTLELLFVSGALGFFLALLVAFGRLSQSWVWRVLSLAFTNTIRGTPLLVQIFVMYYGLGSLFSSFPAVRESIFWPFLREGFWYIAFALALSVGAYLGEVIRGGLRSVPKGELEAGYALGMRRSQVIRQIWLPRALQLLLPTLAGETVLLLKSTALASTVAVMDLLGAANLVRAQTLRTYEPLLSIAVVYVVLAFVIERCFRYMEARVQRRPVL